MHTKQDLERIDNELKLLCQQQALLSKRVENLTAVRIYIQREIEEGNAQNHQRVLPVGWEFLEN